MSLFSSWGVFWVGVLDWLVSVETTSETTAFWEVLTLQDYNSRIVVLGTAMLGAAAGLVGSFTLLRKRALMGDALSHATLPGIALAYMVTVAWGGDGKSLPVLMLGATISGLAGVGCILWIRRQTRIKEDAALGIILSVFFGLGVCLLGIIQKMETGHAAGLEAFIYGKTASMRLLDVQWIAGAASLCLLACLLFAKELKLLCFDEGFAGSEGYWVTGLDSLLMGMVVLISIVGLQAVGLILIIALLVIPAAAARFWTQRLSTMTVLSALIGAASGIVGAIASGLFSSLPSGAMIVLVCATFFLFSLVLGSQRGLVVRWWRRFQLARSVRRQHLLRAVYELIDWKTGANSTDRQIPIPISQLYPRRSWTMSQLQTEIRRAENQGLLQKNNAQVQLTETGFAVAERLTHQHRLWELFLIHYAEIAPSRVDRDADAIEHVLEPETIKELERLLQQEETQRSLISPHALSDPVQHAAANRSDQVSNTGEDEGEKL